MLILLLIVQFLSLTLRFHSLPLLFLYPRTTCSTEPCADVACLTSTHLWRIWVTLTLNEHFAFRPIEGFPQKVKPYVTNLSNFLLLIFHGKNCSNLLQKLPVTSSPLVHVASALLHSTLYKNFHEKYASK